MSKPPPLSVFIDSNVYLSFFSYTDEDLNTMLKIKSLIENGTIQVFLPEQVRSEFLKRREDVIATCIKTLTRDPIPTKLPAPMKDLPEAKAYVTAAQEASKKRFALVESFRKLTAGDKLLADAVTRKIWKAASGIPPEDEIYRRALRRKHQGHPPGKGAGIGDELNWKTLLEKCPPDADLFVISTDGDYSSSLQPSEPKQYLHLEWKGRKNSILHVYQSLSLFLDAIGHKIKLVTDQRKEQAIAELINSPSFSYTHSAVANLTPYIPLLTQEDVGKMAEAARSNSQIYSITGDWDVREFYQTILKDHIDNLEPELRAAMMVEFFGERPYSFDELDDEVPF